MTTLEIQTPRVFAPLLEPKRYKGAWGGRGSGKSHFFGELLIERALMQPGMRAACIREVQQTLKESSKRLLEDKIAALGVGHLFDILESEIRTPGGGVIIFRGMQAFNANSIKSLEGYDVAWCEEAQSISARSLRLLRPTIRKPGSELWFSWNPDSEKDPVDDLLRGANGIPADQATVVRANWSDNPFFPDVLNAERLTDLARRPEEYDHIWEGGYALISDAVIFRGKFTVEAFETPSNARFFHGADWGFANDPTALVRCWMDNETLFVDAEAFGHGVEIDNLPALFDTVPTARQWPCYGDSSRPETISYMARHGFPKLTAAKKWDGSVEDGIEYLRGFKRILIHPRCTNVAREFRVYSYKVDRRTEEILPVPADRDNHGIDALRYALDGYIKNRQASRRANLTIMAR